MKSANNSRLLMLAALAGTLVLTACASQQTRPSPKPEAGVSSSPEPAAPRSAPSQPKKWNVGLLFPEAAGSTHARAPKQVTVPASGASSVASPAVPRVPSFACIPVDNYHAMQKKLSKLKSAATATDKRNRVLEAKLKQQAAERAARRKARQLAQAASPPPKQLEPLLSRKVVDSSGDSLGRIVGVLVDTTGRVRAAVIELGGFLGVGTRKIAVEWSLVDAVPAGSDAPVKLKVSRETVDAAPTYTGAGAAAHELVRAPAPPPAVGSSHPDKSRPAPPETSKTHKAAPSAHKPKASAKPKKPQRQKAPAVPTKPAAPASVKDGPGESVSPPSSAVSTPASVSSP